jgi:hypothetical protein
MSEQAELGMNRTGTATSPKLTSEMLTGQQEFAPDYPGDERTLLIARSARARELTEPVGSVPPPTTLKGVVKTGMTALTGESPTLLIDKLGARLGFERSGVRIYEALLAKFDGTGGFDGGPTRMDIQGILEDEYKHFQMLIGAAQHLGADPTVMTPSADLQATIGNGALQVITDPRTTFAQCLEAALAIELIDNDSWELLIGLTEEAGQKDLATSFRGALEQEVLHLTNVRRWLARSEGLELAAE